MKAFGAIAIGALVSVAQAGHTYNAPVCQCSKVCQAVGDPHVTDFGGVTSLVPNTGSIVLYDQDDFTTQADLMSAGYMEQVSFGSEQWHNSSCTEIGPLGNSSHTFSDGDSLSIQVTCSQSDDNKNDYYGFYLDVSLTKSDVGNGAWDTLERSTGSTGLCTANLSGGTAHCSCTGECQAYGDPHIISFYDETTVLTQDTDNLVLYHDGHFKLTTNVSDMRIRVINFGGPEIDASTCTKTGDSQTLTEEFNGGDSLVLTATCDEVSGSEGFFYNVVIRKTDNVNSDGEETFQQAEEALETTGACVLNGTQRRRLRAQ